VETAARDQAIILLLALQHGTPLKTICHAVTRNEDGSAATVIGAAVDHLSKGTKR
jgi:ribonucleoside-diphosphate reductase alpha chain